MRWRAARSKAIRRWRSGSPIWRSFRPIGSTSRAIWRPSPRTLNIGLDALVLLDDNPAERAQVRAALPSVAAPELPSDPAWFAWTLGAAGYFETVGLSDEDRLRAATYASDAHRAEVRATARDLGDYLASLDMRMAAGPFDAAGRTRIAQLINKTNQFNLTTRRYTEAQVAALEADPATITLQVRLADRFGDLGMIGVVIANVRDGPDGVREAAVDSWLMSCRVLGRKVEEAMLQMLLERAAAAGAARIAAHYRPTPKNAMVRDLLDRLGFTLVGGRGATRILIWLLSVCRRVKAAGVSSRPTTPVMMSL